MLDPLKLTEELAARLSAKSERLTTRFNLSATRTSLRPNNSLQLDGTRLGHFFEFYMLFGETMRGNQLTLQSLFGEWVCPLETSLPGAYAEGLAFLEEKADVFGARKDEWLAVIADYRISADTRKPAPLVPFA